MAKEQAVSPKPELPLHGAAILPSVTVDSYNVEIEDEDGFIGDKASKAAFWELVDKWRKPLREIGDDPFGSKATDEIPKKKLEKLLEKGTPESAALIQSAVEDFARQLASIIRRYLRLKEWRDTECIVVGGGFRASRVGQLAIARTALLLRADGLDLTLEMIRNTPDEAGLLGSAHLLPAWMLKGHTGMLAVDVGGTNIRAGVVELNLAKAADLTKARVSKFELWRHGEEDVNRDDATDRLIEMLQDLTSWCRKNDIELAPVIGVACPGLIQADGSIQRGGQNLPGNWESGRFNLPQLLRKKIPKISGNDTFVVMHNDAVVQGLSELPRLKEKQHWGALTIGTGLGNARYTNRRARKGDEK